MGQFLPILHKSTIGRQTSQNQDSFSPLHINSSDIEPSMIFTAQVLFLHLFDAQKTKVPEEFDCLRTQNTPILLKPDYSSYYKNAITGRLLCYPSFNQASFSKSHSFSFLLTTKTADHPEQMVIF